MASMQWTVQLADGNHTVVLEHGYMSGRRVIAVDGVVVLEEKKLFDTGSTHAIPVGSETGVVRITTNGLTFKYDLVINGRSQGTGEPVDAEAPTSLFAPPPATREKMEKELRTAGIILSVLGALHLLMPDTFVRLWGLLLLGSGLASLFIRRREMFILLGLQLVVIGAINVFSSLESFGFWTIFGLFQVALGGGQIASYRRYPAS